MDSELVKDRATDVILTKKLPKCGELLLYLRCASYRHVNDPVLIKIKSKLAARRKPVLGVGALPMNIPQAALNFMLRAVYYACVTPATPDPTLPAEFTDTVNRWKMRCLLHLGDEEEEFGNILNDFARVYSYVCLPATGKGFGPGFTCPLCVINTVFTDIGWTDLVCPKPEGSSRGAGIFQREISQRGVDKGYPTGFCRHLLSFHTTFFDNILFTEHSRDHHDGLSLDLTV